MKKPITPKGHAIIDYILVGSLFAAPLIMDLKKDAKLTYVAMGTSLLTYLALTDSGVAIKPVIPFKTHCKVDIGNVLGSAAIGAIKSICQHKQARWFHAAFVVLGALNLALTDCES